MALVVFTQPSESMLSSIVQHSYRMGYLDGVSDIGRRNDYQVAS